MKRKIWAGRLFFVFVMVLGGLLFFGAAEPVRSSPAAVSSGSGSASYFEIAKLTASDGQVADQFGLSVGVSGDTLVVGARYEDGGPGDPQSGSGAAYIYERNWGGANNWGEVAVLRASDGQAADQFGLTVAIDGDTIAVGAVFEDGGPGDPISDAGAVYVFERDFGGPDNWGQAAKIIAADRQQDDNFGVSLALLGNLIAIGASREDGGGGDPLPDAGAVYLFDRDMGGAGNWGQVAKLAAGDAQSGDLFGNSVALTEGRLVVGAVWEGGGTGDPIPASGAAYVFEPATEAPGSWSEVAKLAADDAESSDNFGISVAIDGETIVVGAAAENGAWPLLDAGAGYIFERNFGGANNWGQSKKLTPDEPQDKEYFGVSTAIQDDTILVGAHWSEGEPSPFVDGAGAVYVFERHLGGAGNWGQHERLISGDQGREDHFGISIGFDGDALVVGAFRDDGEIQNSDLGAAYVIQKLDSAAYIPYVSFCRYLYRDDFSNSNSGWPVASDGNILLGYLNGEYRIRIIEPFWTVVARPGALFTDFLLSAEVRRVNINEGTAGLVFGLSSDFNQMYTFEINSEQGYELWRLHNGWTLLRSGTSSALLPGLNTNKLAVERNGFMIDLFANGVLIESLVSSSLSGLRHVGVVASNADEGALDIRFDNFEVLPIGCGLSAASADSPAEVMLGEAGPPGYILQSEGRR